MKKYSRRNAAFKILIIALTVFLMIFGIAYTSRNASSDESNTGNESQTIDSGLNNQLSEILLQKQSLTPTQQKIDRNLLQTIQEINEQVSSSPNGDSLISQNFSTAMLRINNGGILEVKLTVLNVSDEQINQLKALGMDIKIILPEYGIVEGVLPYDAVETVASLDFVKHVGTPGYPIYNTGSVTSEGDSVLLADSARSTFGINGSGSKIGVMSSDIDHLANSVTSGDLPSSPPVDIVKGYNPNLSDDEGTAMLEIIHDLAPGAGLAFYGPTTSSDMVVGIGALEAAGCNIIVDDITFFDEPKFEDGPIAQRARQFVDNGGVYVASAGNSRLEHYNHQYVRMSDPGLNYSYGHDYDTGAGIDIGNSFTIPNGGYIIVILRWNNQCGLSGDDFDLFLSRSSNGSLLAYSNAPQDGDDDPLEGFDWYNDTGASISVFVSVLEYELVSDPNSLVLDYTIYPDFYPLSLQYNTTSDSVIGHAAVEEVLSTAAVKAATPSTLEDYSSCGPGTIYFPSFEERQVPNITGVDGVQTRTGQLGYFSNPFYGTSAAAPHIAAIAALIWDANPTLNSSQVRSAITSTAAEPWTLGFDYCSGWGRASASAAVDSVAFTLTVSSSGGTVTAPGIGSFRPYIYGQVVNISVTPNPCYHFINWSGDTDTIANTSAASTTITMNASYSITANFATDPYDSGNGSPGNPYLIYDVCDLQNMSSDLGAYYILANDIDASATSGWNGGAGFLPIGNNVNPFTGSFDGHGYTITGLFINRAHYVGLFGYIGTGSTITNVSLIETNIIGRESVGGLVGYAWYGSTVSDCYVSGNVTRPSGYSSSYVGGLIGYNCNIVSRSYATGNVNGSYYVGGLVGMNGGTVSNSYATNNVSGYQYTGGLVGMNSWGLVNNSYATGNVSGHSCVGGLVGWNSVGNISKSFAIGNVSVGSGLVGWNQGGTVSNSFWDIQTSGQSSSDGGTGKNTSEMKSFSTFFNAGWDLICESSNGTDDIWGIDQSGADNNGYPFLSWQGLTHNVSFTLIYSAGAGGVINSTSPQTVNCSENGSAVEAVPNSCYHFVNWSDGLPTASRTDTNVTNNIAVQANFAINTSTFTYIAGSHGNISGNTSQTVNCNESSTAVEAIPDPCYHFVNWSDGLPTASRTDYYITDNISFTANFAPTGATYNLTINSSEYGNVTSPSEGAHGPYNCSATVNLTAEADYGYEFVSWTGNIDRIDNIYSRSTNITMYDDYSIMANFGLPPSGNYSDADNNGKINAADIAYIKAAILGKWTTPNPGTDADADGRITAADIAYVKAYILGKWSGLLKYEVTYDFLSGAGSDKWANISTISSNPPNDIFDNESGWTTASPTDYSNIRLNDSNVWTVSGTAGNYSAIQCKFTIASNPANITSIGITLNGSSSFNGSALRFWAWNFTTSSWMQLGSDFSITTNISNYTMWAFWRKVYSNYIDPSNHMFILATLNTSAANLNIDDIKLTIAHF